jgi:hypothetical protein
MGALEKYFLKPIPGSEMMTQADNHRASTRHEGLGSAICEVIRTENLFQTPEILRGETRTV